LDRVHNHLDDNRAGVRAGAPAELKLQKAASAGLDRNRKILDGLEWFAAGAY
jgi:hypothetical protein